MTNDLPSIVYDGGIVMIGESDLSKLERKLKRCGADYETGKVLPKEEEMSKVPLNKN